MVRCLREQFPNAKFYKEGEVKKYPSFYIRFTSIFSDFDGFLEYDNNLVSVYFQIQYREASDPTLVLNLTTLLDEVRFKLLKCLRYFTHEGETIPIEITSNEIIDNMIVFEGSFNILVNLEELKDEDKMEEVEGGGIIE